VAVDGFPEVKRSKPVLDRAVLLRWAGMSTVRLAIAAVALAIVGVLLVSRVSIASVTSPTGSEVGTALTGDRLTAVISVDKIDERTVAALEQATAEVSAIAGVARVESPTNALTLYKHPDAPLLGTPAFGSASKLPASLSISDRVTMAATSKVGAASVVGRDGHTLGIHAYLDGTADGGTLADATTAFESRVRDALAPTGARIALAGSVPAADAMSATVRTQMLMLALLVLGVPVVLAALVLRRRVPASLVLGAGGLALVVAGVTLPNRVPADSRPLANDSPAAAAMDLADEQLHGSYPLVIEIRGPKDSFADPNVLARVDALGNWLRDEYGVDTVGLSSTLRHQVQLLTGVDAVPAKPEHVAAMTDATREFDGGGYLRTLIADDGATAWLYGSLPDKGDVALAELSRRFGLVATTELRGQTVEAAIATRRPDVNSAAESMGRYLLFMGVLAMAAAVAVAAAGDWVASAAREGTPETDPEPTTAGARGTRAPADFARRGLQGRDRPVRAWDAGAPPASPGPAPRPAANAAPGMGRPPAPAPPPPPPPDSPRSGHITAP
jgi:hypothetical protein